MHVPVAGQYDETTRQFEHQANERLWLEKSWPDPGHILDEVVVNDDKLRLRLRGQHALAKSLEVSPIESAVLGSDDLALEELQVPSRRANRCVDSVAPARNKLAEEFWVVAATSLP